ncbi:MAG TPA: 50S ribosomal protein L24 [Phycisphaeraceae bacterium]|nr:50S ribosomal protein L24 [Phycisphaeraceae bacterium]
MPRHVKKGDSVIITAGAFKGMTGEIIRVLTDKDRVVVKGPRIKGITKHMKPSRLNPQGAIITLDRTFHISNVSPVVDGKPTRVRFQTKPDGSKVRVAARNGKELSVLRSADRKKKA